MSRRGTAIACSTIAAAVISCTDYRAAVAPSADAGTDDGSTIDGGNDANGSSDASELADGDAAACPAETCEARAACTFDDFAAGCDEWTVVGEQGTTAECINGKLHIAADGTLDVRAERIYATPSEAKNVRVALRIDVAAWDGGRVLSLTSGGTEFVEIRAASVTGGMVRLSVCAPGGACEDPGRLVAANVEHLVVIDITALGAAASVECLPLGTIAAAPIARGSTLGIRLGKVDADPIDATVDDVLVWFMPL